MLANHEPVRRVWGRFGVRRIRSGSANSPFRFVRRARAVGTVSSQCHRAVGRTTDNQTLSMEGESSQASTRKEDEVFVWNQSIMINKSNVKIGDVQYYHPFPSRKDSSQCWNFFRCRLDVDYKSLQDVYCLRCCKKLKSKPGEEIKYSFYTLKWQQGYAT